MIFLATDLRTALSAVLVHAETGAGALLNYVNIRATDDTTVTFEATNRYTMGTMIVECDGPESILLPTRVAKDMIDFLKGVPSGQATLTLDGWVVSLQANGEVRTFTVEPFDDRTFPNARYLIPATQSVGSVSQISLNPQLLALFAKSQAALGVKGQGMVFTFVDANKPTRVEFAGTGFVGLIMPMRLLDLPGWQSKG